MQDLLIENFSIKLDNKWVLNDINIKIEQGEVILLTGKNGSGKSTLLRSIAKLFPEGIITDIRGKISTIESTIVFQRPETQIISFKVDEELSTPLSFQKIPRKQRFSIINDIINEFHISDIRNRDPRKLSSGQRQSVVILTSYISTIDSKIRILLLDEPFSVLDRDNRNKVLSIIKKIKKRNISILIVHHNPHDLKDIVTRVIELEHGKIVYDGNYFDYIHNHTFPKFKLETIYSLPHYKCALTIGYEIFKKQISFNIYKPGVTLIIGRNGSGKTTLLKTIAGFLSPLKGKCPIRVPVIMIPQNVNLFFLRGTVREEFNFLSLTIPEEWLEFSDLSPFLLSEGQKKKLAIDLIYNQFKNMTYSIIIMDEPTQSLDYYNLLSFHNLIWKLAKNHSIIIAINDPRLVDNYLPYCNIINMED